MSAEAAAFHAFEHAGWQAVPAEYDDAFAELTPQAAEPLLEAAGVRPGTKLLELASGPGYVAAEAAARGAEVTGTDFAAAMVEHARRRHPHVDFRVADAQSLPFAAATFDAVVMNFGLLHLSRPERAIREAFRVLRTGGRFAFTVWAPPEHAIGFGIVLRAVQNHGTLEVPLPPGPPFFHFSDTEESTHALRAAGFADPRVRRVPLLWRLPAPDALFERLLRGTVRTAALLRAQEPAAAEAIRAAVTNEASRYRRGEHVELPMPAVLASASKP